MVACETRSEVLLVSQSTSITHNDNRGEQILAHWWESQIAACIFINRQKEKRTNVNLS